MVYFEKSKMIKLSIHQIGNKYNNEHLILSKTDVKLGKELEKILLHFYLSSNFKTDEYFKLFHPVKTNLNEVYSYVSNIFDNPESFQSQGINIAKHLYNETTHPNIKNGELYVVYFKDCLLNGEKTDAIGLFKSENKDTFLKVYPKGDSFEIESEKGININKLDKGCLIFNIERENGYVVSVVDNTNKGVEAKYWMEDFLNVKPRNDEYAKTQSTLTLYKSFITRKVSEDFGMNKAEQAALLNKSLDFFKENTEISLDEFAKEVIQQPELIESFNQYKTQYEKDHEVEISDNFRVSESAVKKQARKFRSVIKLDKNFHIYVHGDEHLIKQGEDKDGWKYYKIYYREES